MKMRDWWCREKREKREEKRERREKGEGRRKNEVFYLLVFDGVNAKPYFNYLFFVEFFSFYFLK